MSRKLIAVDLDGTLTLGGRFWHEEEKIEPNEKMIEWVNKEYRKRNVIIIHSSRPPEQYRNIETWLIDNKVKFHGLRLGKMAADEYVDDKNKFVKEMENE